MQVVTDHNSKITTLLAIHRSMCGLDVPRGASLDLDEAEYVFTTLLHPAD
jgi:hypothetical protein